MLSVNKVGRAFRSPVINDARNKVIEVAKNQSALLMEGLLANPELTSELKNFSEIVEILVEKGHQGKLQVLAQSPKVSKYAKKTISTTILNTYFTAAPALVS